MEIFVLIRLRLVVERQRRADAGDDVFALGVDEPFAEEQVFTGCGVAGERDARGGRVAHVAEDHGLDVDGRAPRLRNAFDAAVADGLRAHPGLEDGADAAPQLLHRIIRELGAEDLLDLAFEGAGEDFQVVRVQIRVRLVVFNVFVLVEDLVQDLADAFAVEGFDAFGLFHDDVRVHHDQTAVGVPDEAFVVGLLDEAGDGGGGKTDVEDGVHHAGHGLAGAGTAGDQQRVFGIAVLAAHLGLDAGQGGVHFRLKRGREMAVRREIGVAAVRRNGEAGGDRQAQTAHFGQVRTLAAQFVLHGGVAFGRFVAEEIHILGVALLGVAHFFFFRLFFLDHFPGPALSFGGITSERIAGE